ncbi:DinB family protein [Jeotgalibacillus salarius]|uniref:DinB family protein n=1 Tax=Jeotgalibacillus salarius TaxID=546023 RepID=A0A4Y8LG10_9BACL|nr:DinB family protein [Jeotgalibacillus salarius]TFD99446.1 DinB family protein [Jeotgalibacillus salarius]
MYELKLIETYKTDLEKYSVEQLRYSPAVEAWSISQVYDHVIVVAHEYLDQVDTCATLKTKQKSGKTDFGEQLFKRGSFPAIKIKLPDELNAPPSNIDSKEFLQNRLTELSERMKILRETAAESNREYKIKHGGFGWLNAQEWYDLIGMHFRHHTRQIEETNKSNRSE